MPDYIIGTPQFIENLDGWLSLNKQPYADYLFRNRAGVPAMFKTVNDYVYRGMRVSKDQFEDIQRSGLTFSKHTSWSKSPDIARGFVNDPQFMTGNGSPEDVKILIKKRIASASIILDIHSFVLFMGPKQLNLLGLDELSADSAMKEQEVLVSRGLRVSKADITVF